MMCPLLWLVEQKPQPISRQTFKWAQDLLYFLRDHPWKSDSHGLESERKQILTSSASTLACVPINFEVFYPISNHLLGEKSNLPYFSIPRGIAKSVPFPEVRNRKGAESGLALKWKRPMPKDQIFLAQWEIQHWLCGAGKAKVNKMSQEKNSQFLVRTCKHNTYLFAFNLID